MRHLLHPHASNHAFGSRRFREVATVCAIAFAACVAATVVASAQAAPQRIDPAQRAEADRSGRARTGLASYYAEMFFGRKMADGTAMDPQGDNAASLTLPLGTRARVTNLRTGQSAVVTIRDRGPYVKGRIVDLSPATARQIGLAPRDGLARVQVSPIFVPLPDGRVRWGEASRVAAATGTMRVE